MIYLIIRSFILVIVLHLSQMIEFEIKKSAMNNKIMIGYL